MKKVIQVFIVISMLLPNMVNAATFYSNEKISYTKTKPVKKEFEEEKRYRFYKEEKLYSDIYYIEGENDKNYPYQSGEFIQTEFSDWEKEKPDEKKDRIIKTKEMYEYSKIKPIHYLQFDQIKGSKDALRFLEIKIYNKEEEISYEIECENCTNKQKINDHNYEQGYMAIKDNDTFILNLNSNYDLENLKVEVYLTDSYGTNTSTFQINALDEEKKNLNDYIDVFLESNMYNKKDSGYRFNIDLKEYIKSLYYEDKKIVKEEKIEDDSYQLINTYTLYAYQDIKYKYYRIEKIYEEGYYVEKENYIKDEKDYKIYYKIKDREKIVFKDNYVIKKRDYDLYDLIEESSIDLKKIKITDTINIEENGLYKVTFMYQDFIIDRYVTLDLPEMMESVSILKRSNVEQVEKISTKTGKKVIEEQKEEIKNEKKKEKNSVFSYLSISFIYAIRKMFGL